jgi:hypothetical protein
MYFKILSDQDTEVTCFLHSSGCCGERLAPILSDLYNVTKPVPSVNADADREKITKLDVLIKKLREEDKSHRTCTDVIKDIKIRRMSQQKLENIHEAAMVDFGLEEKPTDIFTNNFVERNATIAPHYRHHDLDRRVLL